jgi:class 3 adenylate cyclase
LTKDKELNQPLFYLLLQKNRECASKKRINSKGNYPFKVLRNILLNSNVNKACIIGLLSIITQFACGQSQSDLPVLTDSSSIRAHLRWAEFYLNQDMPDSAHYFVERAQEMSPVQENTKLWADLLLIRGKSQLTNFAPRDKATLDFLSSLSIYTILENDTGIARCNLQLGVLNYGLENYERALVYLKEILRLENSVEYLQGIAHYLLALCYSEIGNFRLAERMFELAREDLVPRGAMWGLMIETFTGKNYLNQGRTTEAIQHLRWAHSEFPEFWGTGEFAPIHAFLAEAYLRIGALDSALHYGRITVRETKNEGPAIIYYKTALNVLHQAFHSIGINDSAYIYFTNYSRLKDSISDGQILQRVAEMAGQFEFESKLAAERAEQELREALADQKLKRERLIKNLFTAAFVLAILIALLIFAQRNRISKEKKRSDELLLNILPEEIAKELKEKGYAEAQRFESASILFTDFKEFTRVAEGLSPEDLVREINYYFNSFDGIIEKYGLEKIKTIGDAYMAAGGIPIPDPASVKNTVLAALDMQLVIDERRAEKAKMGRDAFHMRAGIHSGAVVAGIVGRKKFQYDLWGDTVNTASRMESSGEAGKVNISKTTYDYIKDEPDLNFEYRGMIQTKGKGGLEMWFVSRSA